MTLLYPSFLWLLIPLLVLLWRDSSGIVNRIHIIVLILILLTLSRPVLKQTPQAKTIKGKDIIIALDISYSMRATDITPNRYEFAKKTISALLQKSPTDNVMLIAFTSNPLLLSPPTTDHRLIDTALKSLNREFILTKGTSLKKLFKRLSSMNIKHKELILITDGGEEESIEELTTFLQKSQLSLHILALGSKQGTTIKDRDGHLIKDQEGNLVISRINPLLEILASSMSGSYSTASSSAETTADELYSSLKSDLNRTQKIQYHYLELYQIPLGLALLLFLMVHTRGVKYLFMLFSFLNLQATASPIDTHHLTQAYKSYQLKEYNSTIAHLKQIKNPSLQSQITLANTQYKQGKFNQAIESYQSIQSTSIDIKQQLYYNIANAYAKLERYSNAKIYYAKVLQLGQDEDAKYNLKIVALLSDKKEAELGIAHPKSQNSASNKSEKTDSKETKRDKEQPSSGGSGEGESRKEKREKNSKLKSNNQEEKHPLSSKVYELINEGYIYEKQPW